MASEAMVAPSAVNHRGPRPGVTIVVTAAATTTSASASRTTPNHEPPEADRPLKDSPGRYSSSERP